MTVFEYLQAHPNTTSGEIAKGMNKRHPRSLAHYRNSMAPAGS